MRICTLNDYDHCIRLHRTIRAFYILDGDKIWLMNGLLSSVFSVAVAL